MDIINLLELLLEVEGSVGISSFNFMRAFDSVSKLLAKIALVRFGLPPLLVKYLVNQDIGTYLCSVSSLTAPSGEAVQACGGKGGTDH